MTAFKFFNRQSLIDMIAQMDAIMTYTELGQYIAKERGRLTREELAEKAKVHPNTIYNIESGQKIRNSSIIKILNALDHDLELQYLPIKRD